MKSVFIDDIRMKVERAIREGKLDSAHDGGDAYDTGEGPSSGKHLERHGSETQTEDTHRKKFHNKKRNHDHIRSADEGTSKNQTTGSTENKQESPICTESAKLQEEKKPRRLVGTGIKKMTKHGRYTSDITLEEMEGYYHLPAYEAARRMGIGLTILKRLCRKFGVKRWPYQRRRFADMEEEELLRSYKLIQEKTKEEVPVEPQKTDQVSGKKTGEDKDMVDLIIYTISTMYSPTDRKYDQKELIDGLGGCITKLVEALQEMNRRLATFNQQMGSSFHQSSSARQDSPMQILYKLFRASQSPQEPIPPQHAPNQSYHPQTGSSMLSLQYGINNDLQRGFTPYRASNMNLYGIKPGGSLLPVNQMNGLRAPENQLLEILKRLQGGPHMSGNRQEGEET